MTVTITRRAFVRSGMASVGAMLLPNTGATAAASSDFRPELLPSAAAIWKWQTWMASLGPKYTGNDAHRMFVDFLAHELQKLGLDVARDSYTFTRWEARRSALTVGSSTLAGANVPITSVYPYSGQTRPEGVTGELLHGGRADAVEVPADLTGKILYIDAPTRPSSTFTDNYDVLRSWGPHSEVPPFSPGNILNSLSADWPPTLTGFKQTGAAGVLFGWADVSNEKAASQYVPWSRPLQGIPSVWVGPAAGARLRTLSREGVRATLTLEATLTPDSSADMLTAVLPGSSQDDLVIVHTHTDGTNAVEENGGLGLLALAEYFSRLPKAARQRTLVFAFAAGHFARTYVPSMNGFIERYPEMVRKAVASLSIEHLGCREWNDDAKLRYRPTGRDELSIVVTNTDSAASIVLSGIAGTSNGRGVVLKARSSMAGEGRFLAAAGVPTIGFIPAPAYLVAAPPNGYIERVSGRLMYGQIQAFAKMVHVMDTMSVAQLKGQSA